LLEKETRTELPIDELPREETRGTEPRTELPSEEPSRDGQTSSLEAEVAEETLPEQSNTAATTPQPGLAGELRLRIKHTEQRELGNDGNLSF